MKWTVTCPACGDVTPWEHVRVRILVMCARCKTKFWVRPVNIDDDPHAGRPGTLPQPVVSPPRSIPESTG